MKTTLSLASRFVMVSAILIASTAIKATAAPGDLDTTFGTGGIVVTNFGPGSTSDDVRYDGSMALQADGKILVSGMSGNNFALARYNTDGSLDTSFDGDGKVTTDFGSVDFGYAVAVQSDGKIVVAGSNNIQIALARYNTDGSLDTSFDGDGKVTTQAGTSFSEAYTIAVQADGKILAAGTADDASGNFLFAVVRYNTNGTLDTSFDGDGKAFAALGSGNYDLANSIAVQADGKILLAGSSYGASNDDFGVARFNTNGSLDTSFSGDGKLTTTFGAGTEIAYSVAVQSDAKIVVGGLARPGSDDDFGLVRYLTDGTLDTSFDGDGKVTTSFGAFNDYAYSVVVQVDGKIVAAGIASITIPNGDFALARYNTNGSLDTTFGTSGKVTTPVQAGFDTGYSLAIQSDGKFVVAGASTGLGFDFALVRYLAASSATTVTSLNRVNPATTNLSTVNWTLTFAAANTGVSASNFSLGGAAAAGSSVGTPTTSDGGINWNVPVTTGSTDGTLTLSLANATGTSPGVSTSLPFAGQSYTMDKTRPTVTIGAPSPGSVNTGGSASFLVTYTDTNFNASTLATGDITLNTTGGASGTIGVAGSGNTRTVTISSVTGAGTIGITVAAGTASDTAGNTNLVSSPSATFTVNGPPTVTNVAKSANEDVATGFSAADFTPGSYSDPNSDPLATVRITSLPANGLLKISGSTFTVPQDIAIGSIGTLTYTSNLNYSGPDSFGWNGSDGTLFALAGATVNVTVNSVNDNPTAGPDTITRYPTQSVKVPIATLLSNDSDIDGGTAAFVSVNSPSPNGGTVTSDATKIYYTPAPGWTAADSFTYTINDGQGGVATGTVTVALIVDNAQGMSITKIETLGDGSVRVSFAGIPGRTYRVQSSETLAPGSWTDRTTVPADAQGRFQFTDPPPLPPTRFYRSVQP